MSKKLSEIRSILEEHHEMISKSIPLIASENVTSYSQENADYSFFTFSSSPGHAKISRKKIIRPLCNSG